MQRIIAVFLFVVFSKFCFGQVNLVPNGSFEDMTACPQTEDEVYKCVGWQKPSASTTDYASSCAPITSGVKTPYHFLGYQQPYEGFSYMGMVSYVISGPTLCEYIQCKLNSPLLPFHKYELSFFISLANHSIYTINNFGGYVSNVQPYAPTSYSAFTNVPQILAPQFITDTMDWIRVSGIFTALGGEQWLTIGRFDCNGTSGLQSVVPDNNPFFPDGYCYNFVDSISLYDVTQENYIPDLPNVFTPNGDGINDLFEGYTNENWSDYSLKIFNRWGICITTLNKSNNSWDGKTVDGKTSPDGVYYYLLEAITISNEHINKHGFLELIR